MDIVKIGIIGIGNIGTAHLNCIANGEVTSAVVSAVCDINPERLKFVADKYSDIVLFSDYREILKSDIDAVIIAVPHPLHSVIATAAFNAEKHVLLEKPMDITVSAARKLCDAANVSGKKFAIMFQHRTDGLFRRAREIIKNRELGEIKKSVWIVTNWYRTQAYYNSGTWRATWLGEGGGVLLNQAPHNLDIWQWICGMPKTVTAFCNVAKYHNIEVEDEAAIYTEYENGASGVFLTSTGECPGTNRLEISATAGKMVIENGIIKLWKLKKDEREICFSETDGFVSPQTEYSEITSDKTATHTEIIQNFVNSVLYGEEIIAPGQEGIRELTVSCAAYLSAWKGNTKIELPFCDEEYDRLLKIRQANSELRKDGVKTVADKSCKDRWKINW